MRNSRFHNNTDTSSHHGRVPMRLRQQWSIILLFGMAISLAFYNILTAPTVEEELIARRQRGTNRLYRQREYGSSSSSTSDNGGSDGQQQELYQQDDATTPTTAMPASAGATALAADWQSVDGRPVLRIISTSAQADSPVVMFSPLPPHMVTNSIHPNGDSLTNNVMNNATDSNSLASTSNAMSLRKADDESTTRRTDPDYHR
jgi:hypothetical protein